MQRLRWASSYPVTLIVAGAGYGKSLAVRHFLATLETPHVRFDVRPEHAALLGFIRGFSQAFGHIAPELPKTAAQAYERNHLSDTLPADLALWMHAHLQTFCGTVVIDDLHLAQDARIAQFVYALIDRAGQSIRWIIASREMPELQIASKIAYGTCGFIIDERDLALTVEELRAFAGSDDVEEIFDLAHGWPAACAFALAISERSANLRVNAAATREMIYRYLAEQVYASLTNDERDLLLFSARLATVDVGTLEAAGFDRAFATLEGLRKRVAFIVADDSGAYRCHDLFHDFLEYQLALEGAEAIAEIDRRAAVATERIGRFAHALGHYVSLRAEGDIVRVLEGHGLDLFDTGHGDIVHRAIDALPSQIRAENPTILCLRGLRKAGNGFLDEAETLLETAISQIEEPLVKARPMVAAAPVFLNNGRDAIPLLEPFTGAKLPPDLDGQISTLLAVAYAIAGRRHDVEASIRRAAIVVEDIGSEALQAKMLLRLGIAGEAAGLPYETVKGFYLRAEAFARKNGMHATLSRVMGGISAIVLNAEGSMEHVERYAREERLSAQKAGDRRGVLDALIRLGTAACIRGDAAALAAADAEFARFCAGDKTLAGYFIPIRATAAAWRGDFRAACRLLSADDPSFYVWDRLFNRSMLALYRFAVGERATALKIAASVAAEPKDRSIPYLYPRILVGISSLLCAIVYALAGETTTARSVIGATSTAEGPVLEALRNAGEAICRITKNQSCRSEMDMALRALRECHFEGISLTLERVTDLYLCGAAELPSLTQAERMVLRGLDEGYTPKEMAIQTGRSVHTVRTLIQRAMQKLGCSGRQEALHIARRRGMLFDAGSSASSIAR